MSTLDEVKLIAAGGDYRRIPVTREILADIRTPVETMRALMNVSSHCFLLESCEDTRRWGRYSFLGFDPSLELSCKDHILTVHRGGMLSDYDGDLGLTGAAFEQADDGSVTFRIETDHPVTFIKKLVTENRAPRIEGLPTLTGGLVGYFSYEYMKYGEPELKLDNPDEDHFDDVNLMLFDKLICFDNLRQKIILIVNIRADDIEGGFARATEVLDEMEAIVRRGAAKALEPGKLLEPLMPTLSKEEYCRKVDEIKHYIREGDIFQLVFSNPMKTKFSGSLFDTYRVLRTTNPSPYMFYFSGDDVEIAGASPETLVKVENGVVRTFPLAGTRPRGSSDAADAALSAELVVDEKERVEHNMLVDLGRNDLGRLCKFGSILVERYMNVLKYSHVMHLGSEIRGELRDDVAAIDTVDSVLPAGTLSGAPKFRACELISRLEGDRRGIYGGAIGYVDFTGNLDVCIAIRFAVKRRGRVFVRSGAGIVADSVPANEFQECINKAKAVTEAIAAAEKLGESEQRAARGTLPAKAGDAACGMSANGGQEARK